MGNFVVRDRASPEKFDVAYAVDEVSIGMGVFLGAYLAGKESAKTFMKICHSNIFP